MEHRRLGRTELSVSALCLGTMTFGRQNTEAEGHEQMDYALDQGINVFDTAEMYAVPPTAETYGRTEEIIGTWFQSRPGAREKVVLATKVNGRSGGFGWVRGGKARLDRPNIVAALDASLARLRTDRIDLYQLHWSDREVNRFGQRTYRHRPDEDGTPLAETLAVLDECIKAGKVRHVGVSNETPWGLMTYLKLSETQGLPRMASIQNAYNLLNREFETGLAEVALREDCGLLAYSPLAGGTLTGKYLHGAMPPGTRRAIDHRGSRYITPNADAATATYLEVAARHGLNPAQMAIAFVLRQPFVTSVILGATTMDHLRTNVAARDLVLSEDVLKDIEAVQAKYSNPCP